MRSRVFVRSLRSLVLLLAGLGLLAGCASSAPKNRPPLEIQGQKLKISQNACIRLRQAEEEAVSTGSADAANYREAREKACQQYETDKREMDRLQLETPSSAAKARQF